MPDVLAAWLEDLYAELRAFAARRSLATVRTLAEAIQVESRRSFPDGFVNEYVEGLAIRLSQARSAELRSAVVAGEPAAKAVALLERTAERIGREECVRAGAAILDALNADMNAAA